MKKESVKKHESGKCNCRKVMNTTNRLCRACMVPGTRESGDLAMQKRFFISKLLTACNTGKGGVK